MIQRRSLAELLLTMAHRLGDAELRTCCPGEEPAAIRTRLREAAAFLAEAKAKAPGAETGIPAPLAGEGAAKSASSPGRLRLYTDGAARGNPGQAGAGILVLDAEGRELLAKGVYLGQCTNNVAEYQALILGLEGARSLGGKEIDVYLDSELVVKQLLGQYQVKDTKLKPLYGQARELLQSFSSFRIAHVGRAENKRADQLANQGIEQGREG